MSPPYNRLAEDYPEMAGNHNNAYVFINSCRSEKKIRKNILVTMPINKVPQKCYAKGSSAYLEKLICSAN